MMRDEIKQSSWREVLLWLLRRRRRWRVTGLSMIPFLNPGDEVLVDTGAYRRDAPSPGDIVVARHPYRANVRLVKRVVVVGNDGHCLLEGHNPAASTDSRSFGTVPREQILGRVTSRFA